MQYRTLGKSDLCVSAVGLGTGGKSVLGQAQGRSEADAHTVVHKALDLGITFFDTSPAYRDSEAILGRALHQAAHTNGVVICTKVLPYPESGPTNDAGEVQVASAGAIVASVERSLRRLHRDRLDILLLHAVVPEAYDAVIQQVYPVVARLQEEGKIGYLGVSEQARADAAQVAISKAVHTDLFDVVMLRYNLFHQGGEQRVFPITQQKGIGVLGMCPVDPPITRPDQLRAWLQELQEAGTLGPDALLPNDPVAGWLEGGASMLAEKGMKFAAYQKAIDVVITGTANLEHLAHNVRAALGAPLPEEIEAALRAIYGCLDEGRL